MTLTSRLSRPLRVAPRGRRTPLAPVLADTPPKPNPEKSWIKIKVVDDATGAGIPGVTLKVTQPNGMTFDFTTRADGVIEVHEIDPGKCRLVSTLDNGRLADTFDQVLPPHEPKPDEKPDPFFDKLMAELAETAKANTVPTGTGVRINLIEIHKVSSGETLESLALNAGLTWQRLAEFNFGTSIPDEINEHLRDDVGCTKKTPDGFNYKFDDSDTPGIIFIPAPTWTKEELATDQEHVIRVHSLGFRKAAKKSAGIKDHLVISVETPTGKPVATADTEVTGVGSKATDAGGDADHGVIATGSYDLKARRRGYGPVPVPGGLWAPGEAKSSGVSVADNRSQTEKLKLVTVESMAVTHVLAKSAKPERVYKAAPGATDIDVKLTATVLIPLKSGSGPGTQARTRVDWSVIPHADNAPKARGGKDKTDVHFAAATGFAATGDMKTAARTETNDAGETQITFRASAISGDRFTVRATVLLDPSNPAAGEVAHADSVQFEVWKQLDYKGMYRMQTGGNAGVDIGTLCSEANIQPIYTPTFTEYHAGTVNTIAYREFVAGLLPPTAAQLPVSSAVRVRSDGADTRVVTVTGLVVAADGATSPGSATLTLSGTSNVTSTVRFQRVERVSVASNPGRSVTVEEAAGSGRQIAALGPGATAATPNFRFDTDAAVRAKAQAWADANVQHTQDELDRLLKSTGATSYLLVGAGWLHPKHSGLHAGQTTFYQAYPAVRIQARSDDPFHPDSRWDNVDGTNSGKMSVLFMNVLDGHTLGDAYTKGVACHEIGHASDHTEFGTGDHCPQQTCVMFESAAPGVGFCTVNPDHSQRRVRGWK
ncbi:hypothetical protein RAS1_24800 [Phycisphaerae bacterium RAS1]|nr:hypothetical protein RAS1_24800 [Phycisphaerae bacterium RAS1]